MVKVPEYLQELDRKFKQMKQVSAGHSDVLNSGVSRSTKELIRNKDDSNDGFFDNYLWTLEKVKRETPNNESALTLANRAFSDFEGIRKNLPIYSNGDLVKYCIDELFWECRKESFSSKHSYRNIPSKILGGPLAFFSFNRPMVIKALIDRGLLETVSPKAGDDVYLLLDLFREIDFLSELTRSENQDLWEDFYGVLANANFSKRGHLEAFSSFIDIMRKVLEAGALSHSNYHNEYSKNAYKALFREFLKLTNEALTDNSKLQELKNLNKKASPYSIYWAISFFYDQTGYVFQGEVGESTMLTRQLMFFGPKEVFITMALIYSLVMVEKRRAELSSVPFQWHCSMNNPYLSVFLERPEILEGFESAFRLFNKSRTPDEVRDILAQEKWSELFM